MKDFWYHITYRFSFSLHVKASNIQGALDEGRERVTEELGDQIIRRLDETGIDITRVEEAKED